jgi:GrpB-like predicted nucleotidyltransferase (UPF0157 family)
MSGVKATDEPVEVVAARPEWVSQAQALRNEVWEKLGVTPARVEHIGSTAVPGLAAKPLIDLMVGCCDDQRVALAERLADRAGYEYLREFAAPGREYLRRRTAHPWSNVHIVELDGSLWRDNLLFRDFLRSHPDAAREYASAKRAAAEQAGRLRAYSTAKSDTVRALLNRARCCSQSPANTPCCDRTSPPSDASMSSQAAVAALRSR